MGLLDTQRRIYQNLLDFGQGDSNYNYANILPFRYPKEKIETGSTLGNVKANLEFATPSFLRNLPAQLYNSFTMPSRAVQGEMITPQDATDFALTYGGLGMTGASLGGVPSGSIGMFVGKNAKQTDPKMYEKAIEMEKGRVGRNRQFSDGEILEQTGFFRGVDGKWRKEISDDKAEIKPIFASEPLDLYDLIKSGKTTKINVRNSDRAKLGLPDTKTYDATTLENYLIHDELYKNYPELKKLKITEIDREDMRNAEGVFFHDMQGNPNIFIAKNKSPTEKKSILLHELQHAIQDNENFSKGGSPTISEFFPQADVKARVEKLEGVNEKPFSGLASFMEGRFKNPKLTEALQTKDELSYLYDLDYLNSVKNINRPRDAFNTSEYYRYSNEIINKIGLPPKSGSQLEYARKVGDFLARKQKDKMKAKSTADFQNVANDPTGQKFRYSNYETFYKDKTPQQIKNRIRILQQKQDKLPNTYEIEKLQKRIRLGRDADYGVYDNTMMNYDKPYEAYKRLAGETEARLTEQRMNLNNQQRLNPENRMVSYGLRDDNFDVNPNQQLLVFPRGYND